MSWLRLPDPSTYPPFAYKLILAYHTGGHKTALDLGCGPGFIAQELAPSFERVIGIDPSAAMISAAIKNDKVSYQTGDAEAIPLPDSSVDLAVAGQAAHWFNHNKSWPELQRVIRPGGSVVYIVSSLGHTYQRGTARSRFRTPKSTLASMPMDRISMPTGASLGGA